MTQNASLIDVRANARRDRHPLIFSTFGKLPPGQALALVNDHDPALLRSLFEALVPGEFAGA